MMVLLMYISKRVENRSLFASTGLMSLLLSYAVSAARRKELQASGILEEQQDAKLLPDLGDDGLKKGGIPIVNTQEDMEFRTLIWGTLARCCSSDDCARLAVKCDLVQSLLECLNPEPPVEQQKWSQEQRRKVQLEALSALFQLVQYMPDAFMDADGNSTVLQLLQATRSREVQKKSLHLLQVRGGHEGKRIQKTLASDNA